jgi:hypothetical protein
MEKKEEGEHEYFMDCKYEYVFVDPSNHYGFLSDHTDDCFDPVAEERMKCSQRE